MAATLLSPPFPSSSFLSTTRKLHLQSSTISKKPSFSFKIQAAKLPAGRFFTGFSVIKVSSSHSKVLLPKEQPKLQPPFAGFTRTAEIWNSRACMIGLIGTFIVELILNKGILEMVGVEIGKGLDIPL